MIELAVNINEQKKSYPIIIDNECISNLKEEILKYVRGKKYVVVISKRVAKLYGDSLGFNEQDMFILKDGEKHKNFRNYRKILDFCLKRKLNRDDAIIAVGGGVVGDIAGFAASTYMRGIDYIQVPTTLLACVDSSVGGKTAVNCKFGKNLIGAFHQPKAVIINVNFLKTLNLRELKTGLGEVVKYAFIEKSCCLNEELNLINYLSENYASILNYDEKTLIELIKMCILLKISVVEKDEHEAGFRRILNFGHTYGHAVEQLTNYKKYTHGECIVAGIYFSFELALKKELIDKNYLYFMHDVMKKFDFLEVKSLELKKIIPAMKADKKATEDFLRFILPVDYAVVKEFEITELLC